MGIQSLTAESLTILAGYLQVSYAFGAGMVSAVNPCGFVMLPVYISLYLGANEEGFGSQSIMARLLRAIMVAAVMSAGFAVIFGLVGFVVAIGGVFLIGAGPWIAFAVGVLMILVGCWLLLGRQFSLSFMLRLSNKIGDPRTISIPGFFLFGMAYGAASTSCVLPIFFGVVISSVGDGGLSGSLLQFGYYMSGVFLILASLTVGTALLKKGVVEKFLKKLIPYVHKVSAIFLIIAGAYILYYWITSGLL
ncbi:MAG: hypothetical protein OCC45_02775 [Desulfotalea sp.]